MARPTKQGIDFFSLDCNNDSKLELYIAEAGIESFGILISLWQMIYRDQGYYVKYNDDLVLLLRKHTLSSTITIEDAINKAINRDLFSKKHFENHGILTSSGIQKRYLDAAKRKKSINIDDKVIMVDINDYINPDNVNINLVDVGRNATKEKVKVKVKEKVKVNSLREKLEKYLQEKIIENNFIESKDKIFEFFNYRMDMKAQLKYKTDFGINGLLRNLNGCREQGMIVSECIDIAMEKDWKTPDPSYFKNNNSSANNRHSLQDRNKQACNDFVNGE